MRFVTLCLLCLAACGRPLSEGETRLVGEVMGPTLDRSEVRFVEAGFIGTTTRTYPARPRTTCREKIAPPPAGPTFKARTAGAVLFTHVLTSPDWTLPDYLPDYPEAMNLPAAMFLAHEMTHVWQWQNRGITGYHPLRGAAEHSGGTDPYLFDPADRTPFLELGYEQQASLVEEYVCCRTLDPGGARTGRIWERLRAVMPVEPPGQAPWPIAVSGVHPDTALKGICG